MDNRKLDLFRMSEDQLKRFISECPVIIHHDHGPVYDIMVVPGLLSPEEMVATAFSIIENTARESGRQEEFADLTANAVRALISRLGYRDPQTARLEEKDKEIRRLRQTLSSMEYALMATGKMDKEDMKWQEE